MFMFIFVYICLLVEFVIVRGSLYFWMLKGVDYVIVIIFVVVFFFGEDLCDVVLIFFG